MSLLIVIGLCEFSRFLQLAKALTFFAPGPDVRQPVDPISNCFDVVFVANYFLYTKKTDFVNCNLSLAYGTFLSLFQLKF